MTKAFEFMPKEFVSITGIYDHKTPLTSVLGKLDSYGAIVVTKDNEYFGIVDDRTISRKGNITLNKSVSVGKFAKKVKLIDRTTSIDKAIGEFYSSSAKALPFIEGKKITGIVRREKMLEAILSLHLLSDFSVDQLMSSPVVSIEADTSITQAKNVMNANKVNRLVVLNQGRFWGLLTKKDILKDFTTLQVRSETRDRKSDKMKESTAGQASIRNVRTIGNKMNTENAIRTMLEEKVSSVLVMNREKPVGIITVKDIFKKIALDTAPDQEKILISGLDANTKEYEDEIKEQLNGLVGRIDKFQAFEVKELTLNLKHHKSKNYELHGRIMLNKGVISASAGGYSLDEVLKELTDKMYKSIKTLKEMKMTGKKEESDRRES